MPRRSARHSDHLSARTRKVGALPVCQADGVPFQPFGSGHGRHDSCCVCEHLAASVIEIVEVMIVAQENRIDASHSIQGERGMLRLAQGVKVGRILGARRVKGRISEKPKPACLQQSRWSSDVSDGQHEFPNPTRSVTFTQICIKPVQG